MKPLSLLLLALFFGCSGSTPSEIDTEFRTGGVGTDAGNPQFSRLYLSSVPQCTSSNSREVRSLRVCANEVRFIEIGNGFDRGSIVGDNWIEFSGSEPVIQFQTEGPVRSDVDRVRIKLGTECPQDHYMEILRCNGDVDLIADESFFRKGQGPKRIDLNNPNFEVIGKEAYRANAYDLFDVLLDQGTEEFSSEPKEAEFDLLPFL